MCLLQKGVVRMCRDQNICRKCRKPAQRSKLFEEPDVEYYECECGNAFAIERVEIYNERNVFEDNTAINSQSGFITRDGSANNDFEN